MHTHTFLTFSPILSVLFLFLFCTNIFFTILNLFFFSLPTINWSLLNDFLGFVVDILFFHLLQYKKFLIFFLFSENNERTNWYHMMMIIIINKSAPLASSTFNYKLSLCQHKNTGPSTVLRLRLLILAATGFILGVNEWVSINYDYLHTNLPSLSQWHSNSWIGVRKKRKLHNVTLVVCLPHSTAYYIGPNKFHKLVTISLQFYFIFHRIFFIYLFNHIFQLWVSVKLRIFSLVKHRGPISCHI